MVSYHIRPCFSRYWQQIAELRMMPEVQDGLRFPIKPGDITPEMQNEYMATRHENFLVMAEEDCWGTSYVVGYSAVIDGDLLCCVHPDHQGKGIGTKLLTAIREKFSDVKIQSYVKADNIGSRKMLERSGFKVHENTLWYLVTVAEES